MHVSQAQIKYNTFPAVLLLAYEQQTYFLRRFPSSEK